MIRYNDETDNLIENNYLKYAYMYSENIFLNPVCGRCTKGRVSVNNNLNNIIAIKNVLK